MIGIIRKMLPKKMRDIMGGVAYKSMQRFPLLAIPFVYISYGVLMRPRGDKLLITHQGIEFSLPRRDWVSFPEIFHDRVYEQLFSMAAGDVVIDIGAHVGVFTIKAAKAVGEKGQVVAIEPEPKNVALLRHNIASNGIENVIVIGKAVTSYKGKAKLNLSDVSSCDSIAQPLPYSRGDYIEVETDSLDNIVSELGLSRVDFIKIDAEGSEPEILKGAERTLAHPNIKLAIAAYHVLEDGTPEFPQIMSFLSQKEFKIYTRNRQFIYAVGGGCQSRAASSLGNDSEKE